MYDVYVDDEDKIWFTTNNGVYQYNGHQFKLFSTQDGLPTLFNWQLNPDEQGRLWLVSFETPFTYIKNNKVHRVGNKVQDFYPFSFVSHGDSVYVNSLKNFRTALIVGNSLIGVYNDSICIGFYEGEPLLYSKQKLKGTSQSVSYFGLKGKYLFTYVNNNAGRGILKVRDILTQKERILNDKNQSISKPNAFSSKLDDRIVISSNNVFFEIITHVPHIDSLKLIVHGTPGERIGGVVYDKNNQAWKAVVNKGLGFYPSKAQYTSYIKHPNGLRFLYSNKLDDDVLVLVDENKKLFILQHNRLIDTKQTFDKFNSECEIIRLGNQLVVVLQGILYYTTYDVKKLFKMNVILKNIEDYSKEYTSKLEANKFYGIGSIKGYLKEGNKLFLATGRNICLIQEQDDALFLNEKYLGWTNDVLIAGKDTFRSDHNGVFQLEDAKWKSLFNKEGVRSFFKWQGDICFYSYSSRCYNLSKGNKEMNDFSNCKNIKDINNEDGSLIIRNGNELYVFNEEDSSTVYATATGYLGGQKINYFTNAQSHYLVCADGIYILSSANNANTKLYKEFFRLDGTKVNGELIAERFINLSGKNNQLQLSLSVNAYPYAEGYTYQYRFLPAKKWQTSQSNELIFSSIPYDIDGIELRALSLNGEIYGDAINIAISHPTPFYKRTVFYLLLFVLLALLAYYLLKRQSKKRMQELKSENDSLLMQQKMLGLQMKPHFLSNIFNNLQSSLLLDTPEETSRFVQDVNHYLRQTLKSSELQYISLSKEIDYVKNYIKLEQRRIEKKLKFSFSNPENIDLEQLDVPVFCLQPIIENAIWHGIQPDDGEVGIINVHIQKETDYYLIHCEDNGVGFENSGKKGNSISLKNINQRMALADSKNRDKYFEIQTTQEGGTKITLYVPRKPKYYHR